MIRACAAQLFHVLRRQMNRPFAKPLVLATPKWLLHHHRATSALQARSCIGPLTSLPFADVQYYPQDLQTLLQLICAAAGRRSSEC